MISQLQALFVLGTSCSAEEDLTFVNLIWKQFENEAEKARERLLGQMKELHSVFKEKFPQMEFLQELQSLEVK